MKSLLDKLIGRQPAARAADLSWLTELNQLEEMTAIEISTQKLKACLDDDGISASEHLKFALAVDMENRQRTLKIRRQFVDYENLRPELEERTVNTMYFYLRQIFITYRSMIDRFLDANGDIIFTYNRLPIVLGRALEAAYAMTRWRYYRQQSAPDMTWPEIYGLFRILEQESLLDLTAPLYPEEPEVHLAASFVQACMLDSLGNSSLSKQQIDKVALLLQKLIPWSNVSKHYDEQRHLFYIDLSGNHGARRIRMQKPRPDFRYWDTDSLSARVDAAIQALDRNLPHDLENIGSNSDLLETLTLLQSEWSRTGYTRQRRAEERRKVIKQAVVSYGFQNVCNQLKDTLRSLYKAPLQESGHSLDDKLVNHNSIRTAPSILYRDISRERWMISDESNGGYGVIFSDELPPTLKLGKLVGLVVEGLPDHLIIGNIKSINKPAKGDNHIGIKIIGRQATWVQLSHASYRTEISSDTDTIPESGRKFSAIFLSAEQGRSDYPTLLLPRVEYLEHGSYQLLLQNQKSMVQLGALIESRDDWVQVRSNYPDQ
jgi:hypothetical protein